MIINAVARDPKLVSIDLAALALRVSPWTVRSWLRRGHLSAHHQGGKILVDLDEAMRIEARCWTRDCRPVELRRQVAGVHNP